MSARTSGKTGKTARQRNDDFRLIKGISRNFKLRLHEHGIRTFEQLSNLSPHEILAMIGPESDLTIDRIKRDDWIGQAKSMAEEAAALKNTDHAPDENAEDAYASFALELKLDLNNRVIQTRILYIDGKGPDAEEQWPGWNGSRLLSFIEKSGKIAPAETLTPSSEAMDVQHEAGLEDIVSTASSFPPEPFNDRFLNDFKVVSKTRNSPTFVLKEDEPYSVNLSINSSDLAVYTSEVINFRAVVRARNLSNSLQTDVGMSEGAFEPGNQVAHHVDCRSLPSGDYRLSAVVTLNIRHRANDYDLKSVINGSIIHVC